MDDPREQAPTDDLDPDQMEQAEPADEQDLQGFAPEPTGKRNPHGMIEGSGDR